MSVASPPRMTGARPSPRRTVIENRPLRYPNTASRPMMTRRAWWLLVLNFLIPGSAQVLAGNRRLGRFGLGATLFGWMLIALSIVTLLLWQQAFVAIATNWFVLLGVQALLFAYLLLWIILTIDTLRLVRLVRTGSITRFAVALVGVGALVLAGSGVVWASDRLGGVRDSFGAIFAESGPSVPPSDGYYNILLLGADSGEGRDSMRYDSISVASINADTGAVTITGIPRDMVNVPFAPGPMQDLYPNGHTGHSDPVCGWGSGINQLRTEVEVCRDGTALYPDAVANGSEPGIEATKDAAEGLLGIEIPYYVFIDMHGFAALVDALGGVDIEVTERLPKGGGPSYDGQPAEEWAIGWIEPGLQHMDGDTAQWYARSRYTTSDWDRMLRQRQLQEAILAQFTPMNVLNRFNEVLTAGTAIVQTDIPQSMVPYFAELALKSKEQPVTTIELTPSGVGGIGIIPEELSADDVAFIQDYLRQALHPPTPTPTPAA